MSEFGACPCRDIQCVPVNQCLPAGLRVGKNLSSTKGKLLFIFPKHQLGTFITVIVVVVITADVTARFKQ